jgi:ubiquinone biosynthesis protein COQ9
MENIAEIKQKIMHEAIKNIVFDGISARTISKSCSNLNYDSNYGAIYFPQNERDLIKVFFEYINNQMSDKLLQTDISKLKIREKIKQSIVIKLELLSKYKESVRVMINYSLMPNNLCFSLNNLWASSSEIWYIAGDKSTDYNYYSKRALLSIVYSATIMYWLNDESENFADTQDFLTRKIDNIISFATWMKKIF